MLDRLFGAKIKTFEPLVKTLGNKDGAEECNLAMVIANPICRSYAIAPQSKVGKGSRRW
jgi:hypothetical protein